MEIKTKRLLLRLWDEKDLIPFRKLNQDPRVMEFFPSTLTSSQSDAVAHRMGSQLKEKGWGFWAASLQSSNTFIGLIGIEKVSFSFHFTPAVEIGWRLAYPY